MSMSVTVILKQRTNRVGMTYTQPALPSKEGTTVLMRRKLSYIATDANGYAVRTRNGHTTEHPKVYKVTEKCTLIFLMRIIYDILTNMFWPALWSSSKVMLLLLECIAVNCVTVTS